MEQSDPKVDASWKAEQMANLSKFLVGQPGYFREGCDREFPWGSTDRSVWYALLVVENGAIERYGFTSSKAGKAALHAALGNVPIGTEVLLLGVWTGRYRTDLFVLTIDEARERLAGASA